MIPVKDDAEALAHCLAALAGQSVTADEVLVVDNNSTDDSAAVATAAGALVLFEGAPGIAAAASTGYDAARGDVIARLDADCIPGVLWLETIVRGFDDDADLSAITGGAYFIDGPRRWRSLAAVLYLGSYFLLMGAALGHVPLFGSNVAFRRSVWQEVAPLVHRRDMLMHDDVDLSIHIGPKRKIRFLRSLRMGISMRPLTQKSGQGLRLRRGFHSLTAHWPHDLPWLRGFRRLAGLRRSPSAPTVRGVSGHAAIDERVNVMFDEQQDRDTEEQHNPETEEDTTSGGAPDEPDVTNPQKTGSAN
ncbi:MAG: hypothetical protein JWO10_117 [Microbacteriaceae bacterium]|nr:hypothetical protein [Microbacteriaceae bacterium]